MATIDGDVRRRTVEVGVIVGSLRRDSFNRHLLGAAQELTPADMRLTELPIRDLPLFNADLEGEGDPPAVERFKAGLAGAEAILVISPEYNQSIPGVLKNALDWGSRTAAFRDKPVAMLGVSAGRFGMARAQLHLRQLFPYLGMYLLPKPEVYIDSAERKFNDDGVLTDEESRDQVSGLLTARQRWTVRLRQE